MVLHPMNILFWGAGFLQRQEELKVCKRLQLPRRDSLECISNLVFKILFSEEKNTENQYTIDALA